MVSDIKCSSMPMAHSSPSNESDELTCSFPFVSQAPSFAEASGRKLCTADCFHSRREAKLANQIRQIWCPWKFRSVEATVEPLCARKNAVLSYGALPRITFPADLGLEPAD